MWVYLVIGDKFEVLCTTLKKSFDRIDCHLI